MGDPEKTPGFEEGKDAVLNRRIAELKAKGPTSIVALLSVQSAVFVAVSAALFLFFPASIGSRGLSAVAGNEGWNHVSSVADLLVFSAAFYVVTVAVNFGVGTIAYLASPAYRRATKKSRGTNSLVTELPLGYRVLSFAVGALGEEAVFRWALFPLAASLVFSFGGVPGEWSIIAGIAMSSLVFTLMHIQYKSAAQLGIVFLLGGVFCIAYIASGSILVPLLAHFASNMTSAAVSDKMTDALDTIVASRSRHDAG